MPDFESRATPISITTLSELRKTSSKTLDRPPDSDSQKTLRSLQTLLHPESMGTQYHYLALSKGVDSSPKLSSFRFARDPYRELFPSVV